MAEGPRFWSTLAEHWHFARTLRRLEISFDRERCAGVWECYEVCPVGCWAPDAERQKAVFQHAARCIACGACVLQCPEGAIELKVPDG